MAQDPDRPLDDGRVRMPRVDSAMNRVAPSAGPGGRGTKDDDKPVALRQGSGRRVRGVAEKQAEIVKSRKRYDLCTKANQETRKDELDDLKFFAGEQWPSHTLIERTDQRRPCLTINKVPTFVHQVTNEERMNRPAIGFSPIGDKGDPDVARMLAGVVRYWERECQAEIAYDWGFESTVKIGEGYWRTVTCYAEPDSFQQTVAVQRIRNTFTVYLDPAHQDPTGADAKYAFITDMVPREEFKALWPDADPMNWQQGGPGDGLKDWITQDRVRIAEYFSIEYDERQLVHLANGHVGYEDELDEGARRLEVINRRTAHVPKVIWSKMSGVEILEEEDWLGTTIPIVKVIGDEIDIEGKVKYAGIIRFAKDAQRSYNYAVSAETEIIALQPKAPYVGVEGQFEGHEEEWKQSNVKNMPYLEYKQTDLTGQPAPPPQRQPFPTQPSAWAALKQAAAQDMNATTGIRFDATLQEKTYDESGRALRELRRAGDVGSFHYTDNCARSLRRQGEIFLELIPKLLDTKQIITILRENGDEEQVQVDPGAPQAYGEGRNPVSQKVMKIFNPGIGRYGVTVTIGPSYATKRVEAAESMMDFVRALPQAGQLVMDLIAKNQDWPDADQFATRLAKALPPQVLSPEVKDVPPQVQAMLQQLQQQIQQMTAERAAMMQQLTDQSADRQQRQDKIDKDFEAKLLGIVQKAEDSHNQQVATELKALAEGVNLLREQLATPMMMPDEPRSEVH
jgi:hypothetical protein